MKNNMYNNSAHSCIMQHIKWLKSQCLCNCHVDWEETYQLYRSPSCVFAWSPCLESGVTTMLNFMVISFRLLKIFLPSSISQNDPTSNTYSDFGGDYFFVFIRFHHML